MSNSEDKIPAFRASVYHSVRPDPQFEQAYEGATERFPAASFGAERALDRCDDSERLF